jgi:cytochrome P450
MIVPPDWVPIPRNLRFKRALRLLDEAVYALIDARQDSGSQGDDLLGMLLQARDPDNGQPMSRQQLRDEVITLLIAGHETVASALTWTFYLLAQSPNGFAALQEEVQTILAGRLPTSADLPKLAYTGQVFDEALRLYPPAWLITRKSLAADSLDGRDVLPGALFIISPYAIHRHPDVWAQPEVFDPGRFAEGAEPQRPRFAYIPFGGGPRLCIGNHFALTEARLILAMVAQRFQLELLPGSKVVPDPLVTIRPRGGLPMKLTVL